MERRTAAVVRERVLARMAMGREVFMLMALSEEKLESSKRKERETN